MGLRANLSVYYEAGIQWRDWSGTMTVIAGTPGLAGSADGTGPAARLRDPLSITRATNGDLFFSDFLGYTVRGPISAPASTTA